MRRRWWRKPWWWTSAASDYCKRYTVTRSVTSSPGWWRCCNTWGWERHAPHPCTPSQTVEEHLRKVVVSHQRDWDAKLPIFLLAYRPSTHDTMGLTPPNLVFRRELHLPCDLLFGAPPDMERPSINHAADLMDQLHDVHDYPRQHLKLATMTAWPTARATKRVTKCGCIAQPAPKESHPSFKPYGRAPPGWSPESTMWYTEFSDTLERGWW
jgi:hypothetical protein